MSSILLDQGFDAVVKLAALREHAVVALLGTKDLPLRYTCEVLVDVIVADLQNKVFS